MTRDIINLIRLSHRIFRLNDMSHLMGKPTICISENKDADQLRGNREADQRLCFRYSDSTIPLLLNPKFQASSSFLRLYRPVCVRPVQKPHCWFSHEAAHMCKCSFLVAKLEIRLQLITFLIFMNNDV